MRQVEPPRHALEGEKAQGHVEGGLLLHTLGRRDQQALQFHRDRLASAAGFLRFLNGRPLRGELVQGKLSSRLEHRIEDE